MELTGIAWIIDACRGANLLVKLVGTLKCKRKLRFSSLIAATVSIGWQRALKRLLYIVATLSRSLYAHGKFTDLADQSFDYFIGFAENQK